METWSWEIQISKIIRQLISMETGQEIQKMLFNQSVEKIYADEMFDLLGFWREFQISNGNTHNLYGKGHKFKSSSQSF